MNQPIELLFDALNERPIAYQRVYAQLTGSVTAGLLLSQLLYWARAMDYQEFYKVDRELREEIGLGDRELRNAKESIREFVQITRRGVPAKTYYLVKKELIIAKLSSLDEKAKLVSTKKPNKSGRKSQTRVDEKAKLYTENTSETTTENTSDTSGVPPQDSTGKAINLLLGQFELVNPSVGRLFANKTQRGAIERLLKQHGYDGLLAIIQFLPKTNGKQYAPTITTPLQLEEKMGALKAFCDKMKDKATSKGKDIIF